MKVFLIINLVIIISHIVLTFEYLSTQENSTTSNIIYKKRKTNELIKYENLNSTIYSTPTKISLCHCYCSSSNVVITNTILTFMDNILRHHWYWQNKMNYFPISALFWFLSVQKAFTVIDWQPNVHECAYFVDENGCTPSITSHTNFNVNDYVDEVTRIKEIRKLGDESNTAPLLMINLLTKLSLNERMRIDDEYSRITNNNRIYVDMMIINNDGQDPNVEFINNLFILLTTTWTNLYIAELQERIYYYKAGVEAYLTELVATLSNEGRSALNETYRIMYKKTLVREVQSKSSFSPGFKQYFRLLIMVQNNRRLDYCENELKYDINILKSLDPIKHKETEHMMNGMFGSLKYTNVKRELKRIFLNRSFIHLKKLINEYEMTGTGYVRQLINSLNESQNEYGIKMSLMTLYKFVKLGRVNYFVYKFHDEINSRAVDHNSILFLFLIRSEVDLYSINKKYEYLNGKTLKHSIIEKFPDDKYIYFRKATINLLGLDGN